MKAGIAIDTWKLPIFERHLKEHGYTFQCGAGVTPDTFMLYVEYQNQSALAAVVRSANAEAARSRAN